MHSTKMDVIGIDVSKETLDCHVGGTGEAFQVANQRGKLRVALLQLKRRYAQPFLVVESTGSYHQLLCAVAAQVGIAVTVVNPKRIRDFAKALGELAKTDTIDAAIIARYGMTVTLQASSLPSPELQQLRALVSRRTDLTKSLVREKNRLAVTQDRMVLRSIRSHIRFINAERKQLRAEIARLVQAPQFAEKLAVLTSFAGIAEVSAATLIALLPELGSLSKTKITALVGVAPFNNDSGSSCRGKRRIWGGRAAVRSALYMCTLVASRHNPIIRSYYLALKHRGKAPLVALTPCMRKTIIILNAMLRQHAPFRIPATDAA